MAKNYKIDKAGMKGLMMSPEVGEVCVEVAKKAETKAQGIAPRDEGEYAGAFSVTEITENVSGGPRKGAQLVNDSDHAAAVEFGNRRVAGQHVLTRSLEAL